MQVEIYMITSAVNEKAYEILLMSVAVLCSTSLAAQNITFGLKAGVSIPSLKAGGSGGDPLSTGYSSSFGPDGAVFATYKFSNVFSVQTELEYSSQGARRDGMQAFPVPDAYANYFNPGTILYANFKGPVKLSYLVLPVVAKFQWNFKTHSPFKFYIEGGPFIGQLLSAYLVISGNSNVYADASGQQPLLPAPLSFDTTANIKNQLHTTNFGAEANVGISYQLGRGYIFVEGGVNYSFLNIQKEAANGKNTTGAATVCLGYAFTLRNKK